MEKIGTVQEELYFVTWKSGIIILRQNLDNVTKPEIVKWLVLVWGELERRSGTKYGDMIVLTITREVYRPGRMHSNNKTKNNMLDKPNSEKEHNTKTDTGPGH